MGNYVEDVEDIDGKPKIVIKNDIVTVVGAGKIIPVKDEKEGNKIINQLKYTQDKEQIFKDIKGLERSFSNTFYYMCGLTIGIIIMLIDTGNIALDILIVLLIIIFMRFSVGYFLAKKIKR